MTPEASRVMNFLASMPSGFTAVPVKVYRELMLETDGTMLSCGSLYEIKGKSLGAGVWRVSLKAWKP